ncbi:MAG TPA: hypothetical protein VMV51_11565 [Gemmatimonadaceae bacterium]|nr:hypothetical protein [Gemmatimonadaceae bacterium]
MILGHYGVALAAKRAAPRTSLGTLILAAQWADELWPLLLLAGVERVRVVPGYLPANSLEFVSYPYTHSLLALVVWGAVLGGAYLLARKYVRGAWIVGALVVSHWVLDLVVHAPDLPLWPGSGTRLGLGLWHSIAGTLVVEFALLLVGAVVYVRATRARDRIGSWGLWAMLALLAAILLSGLLGPPPADTRTLAFGALGLWLFVPWGYWVDRHRETAVTATAKL